MRRPPTSVTHWMQVFGRVFRVFCRAMQRLRMSAVAIGRASAQPSNVLHLRARKTTSCAPMGRCLGNGSGGPFSRCKAAVIRRLSRTARVSLCIDPRRIVVAAKEETRCKPRPVIERAHHLQPRTTNDWQHNRAVIRHKLKPLREGSPVPVLLNLFPTLQDHMPCRPGVGHKMVGILAPVLRPDDQAVLSAVEMARKAACRPGPMSCTARIA